MFTGIIDQIGHLASVELNNGAMRARINAEYDMAQINLGASIACDGVCLTVISCANDPQGNWFEVDISPETLSVTTLKSWQKGRQINLERAMRIGDEIGGHIVSGHVDGIAKIVALEELDNNLILTIEAPEEVSKFIATKGSVCLNGTSLTVNHVDGTNFEVNLIPHTQKVTTWGQAANGNEINLEIDMLARYVERLQQFNPTLSN